MQLVTNITLRGPAPDYALKFFGPGDELPEWALEEISDSPHLFADAESLTPRSTGGAGENENPDNSEGENPDDEGKNPAQPPVNNPPSRNKSAATWAAYLKEKGVPTPEGASRETLIDIAERNGLL
jgi:hypothetical protein|nr:MAG TPA: hypothetical protein [Caudoviricetes sp.]